MFKRKSPYSFQITLPPYTAREVIEWFEQMSANGTLSNEIIEMVFDNLNNINPGVYKNAVDLVTQELEETELLPAQIPTAKVPTAQVATAKVPTTVPAKAHSEVSMSSENERTLEGPATPSRPVITEETPNFLDNLYDWESSNEAMFNEELSILPLSKKKKMLSV